MYRIRRPRFQCSFALVEAGRRNSPNKLRIMWISNLRAYVFGSMGGWTGTSDLLNCFRQAAVR